MSSGLQALRPGTAAPLRSSWMATLPLQHAEGSYGCCCGGAGPSRCSGRGPGPQTPAPSRSPPRQRSVERPSTSARVVRSALSVAAAAAASSRFVLGVRAFAPWRLRRREAARRRCWRCVFARPFGRAAPGRGAVVSRLPRRDSVASAAPPPDVDDTADEAEHVGDGEKPPWLQKLRHSFQSGDFTAVAKIVLAVGSSKRAAELHQALVEETLACHPARWCMVKFCQMLEGLRRNDAPTNHAVELWRRLGGLPWLQSCGPQTRSLNIVIHALMRAGCVDEALELLRQMESGTCDVPAPDMVTYSRVMPYVAERRGRRAAAALLARARLRGLEPDSLSYLVMVVACVRVDPPDLDAAKRWLRRAEVLMVGEASVVPRRAVVLYNTLMSGYARVGRLQDAFAVLGCMRRRGIRPDNYTFQILMHACMLLSPYGTQECRQLFRVMQLMGVEPTAANYNILIRGYGTSGQLTSALRVANRMREDGVRWDAFTYFYLISAVVCANQVELSLRLLSRMRKDAVRPQSMHYTVTFLGLARAGFFDDAARVFQRMCSIGDVASQMSYNLMICIKTQQGDMLGAVDVREKMENAGFAPNIFTYSALLRGYVSKAMWDEALALEEPIVKLRATLKNAARDPARSQVERARARSALEDPVEVRNWAQAYQLLVDAATWKGEWQHGVELVERMVAMGLPVDMQKHGRVLQDVAPRSRFNAVACGSLGGVVEKTGGAAQRSTQTDWARRASNYVASSATGAAGSGARMARPAGLLGGISPDPQIRLRGSVSTWTYPGGLEQSGEMPFSLVPPHMLCASFSPNWLSGAPPGGTQSQGDVLFRRCFSGHEIKLADIYQAIHDYHHATVHRRLLPSLRLARGQTAIVGTTPKSVASLRGFFESFGDPGAGTVYLFMCPAEMDLQALATLLSAAAAFPSAVLLVRSSFAGDQSEALLQECKVVGVGALSLALESVIAGLPVAVLLNSSVLVACGSRDLVKETPDDFEVSLRAALEPGSGTAGAKAADEDQDPEDQDPDSERSGTTDAVASRKSWTSWLTDQNLRQLLRCRGGTVRLDSTLHRPALSTSEFFRVRGIGDGQIVVDLWIDEVGSVAEFRAR
mmetsp:Transcript_70245/g.195523  ORF Transcript_70245/g.195523 Transcript_70245/m.195523 type:complete len:1102 (+) Transcript_70245:343-3648(+)